MTHQASATRSPIKAVSVDRHDRYARSLAMYERAQASLAGGVSSNFRLGGDPAPLYFERGHGSHITDVDGNDYVDFVLGMGPAILGHAPAPVVDAVAAGLQRGQLFAGQTPDEVELAERFRDAIPCADLVRFGSSGTEMVQAALRLARAATGRPLIAKFEGHYHGWLDPILVSTQPPVAQAGPADAPTPWLPSEGQVASSVDEVIVLPWNDMAALERVLSGPGSERIAALICEPILCNTCVIPPVPGFLEAARTLTRSNGSLLIFDEVITGFRVDYGGAQTRLGITPDLATFAKAMGSGFPIAALAGRRDLMLLTTAGVLHGGTYNANLSSIAAANATIAELARDDATAYPRMERLGERLMAGLGDQARAAGIDLWVQGLGTVFNTTFGSGPIHDYRAYAATDLARQRRFLLALQDRGVRVTSRGTWFLSTAHDDADIERTLTATADVLAALD